MSKMAPVGAIVLSALLAAPGLAASITIHRGSSPATVTGVTVLRGQGPRPAPLEPLAAPPAAGPSMLAGDKIWLVEDGRLVGCRLVNTVMVGIRAIDCAGRRVPLESLERGP